MLFLKISCFLFYFGFVFFFNYAYMCESVFVCVHMSADSQRDQKRVSDPLNLELQEVSRTLHLKSRKEVHGVTTELCVNVFVF